MFALRQQILPHLASDEALLRVEAVWQRGQVLMGELIEQYYVYQQLLAEKRNEVLRDIGQKLITTFHIGQLADILAQELPKLRIRSCYLALYEPLHPPASTGPQTELNIREERYPTAWSRSILAYEDKEHVELVTGGAIFPSSQLVPGDRLHREQPYSMVVEPLYFKDWQLGFVLFEVGVRDGWVYEALRGQLSNALQGALLVEREKHILAEREKLIGELQEALAKIKSLRGLIPICASCKKIRDDRGYWTQLEVYIRDHSEAEFSHSICSDCMQKLYPEFLEEE